MTRTRLEFEPGDPDWFLREWMASAGKKQADISRDLSMDRARVSKIFNGMQPYSRIDINRLSAWLEIEPFELLMHPDEAMAYRQLRESAITIAAEEHGRAWDPTPVNDGPTATRRPRRAHAR
jgi:transcriptional regulator with XRE-family HTH domain